MAQLGLDGIVVSAIGNDELGDEIVACFEDRGLPHMLENSSCPTGTVQISINERGVPQYTIEEGVAWDNIRYNETLKALAIPYREILLSSFLTICLPVLTRFLISI